MRRRHFLTGGASLAVTLAGAETETAAVASARFVSSRSGRTETLKVLVPEMTPEELADLRGVGPEVELIVCKDEREALLHAPEAAASYGFITSEIIKAGQKLRWVQQVSAGVEGLMSFSELIDRPIVLTNNQRSYAPEIADQAIGYLLCFTRGLRHFINAHSRQEWHRPPALVLDELEGKTMLVIALGGIGSQIARRAFGFGMSVLATDPKVREKPQYVAELHKPESLNRLLPRADVVVSAVPLTPATKGLLGTPEFDLMKRGVILLNVSRGKVVDTQALVRALETRKVAGAGLDVTDPEPLPHGHPLWNQNVIITPHSAGQSPGGYRRAHELFRENLRRFARGEMLLNIVDKKAGY
jgi:phosphoglycerate dehydrogenase-like enzyme